MGLLASIAEPAVHLLSNTSTFVICAIGASAFLAFAVILNVLQQLMLRRPREPPVVFHWIPIIGSTITYGIDPYRFFFSNRQKVRRRQIRPSLDSALTSCGLK